MTSPSADPYDVTMNATASPPLLHDKGVAQLQLYFWGVGCFIFSVGGMLGNILSITVLGHRRMRKSSTSCYLIAQAIYDSLVLLSVFFFFTLPALADEWIRYYGYFHAWAYPISLTAQSGGIYTTVAFTVERYVACCHPLKANKMCTLNRSRRVVVLVTLAVIVYNLPRTMEYYTYYDFDETTNQTRATYVETALAMNYYYRLIYLGYMYVFVMFVTPLLVLFVLNIYLIRAVKRSQATRRLMTANRSTRENDNLTVMVISVVLVFLICQFLAAIDNLLNILVQDKGPFTQKFQVVSTFMVTVNAAINFVCYCVFGRKFRRVFFMMYTCQNEGPAFVSISRPDRQSTVKSDDSEKDQLIQMRTILANNSTNSTVLSDNNSHGQAAPLAEDHVT